MKVSKQKMTEHREQIISAAAKRFREKGFDGISVPLRAPDPSSQGRYRLTD